MALPGDDADLDSLYLASAAEKAGLELRLQQVNARMSFLRQAKRKRAKAAEAACLGLSPGSGSDSERRPPRKQASEPGRRPPLEAAAAPQWKCPACKAQCRGITNHGRRHTRVPDACRRAAPATAAP